MLEPTEDIFVGGYKVFDFPKGGRATRGMANSRSPPPPQSACNLTASETLDGTASTGDHENWTFQLPYRWRAKRGRYVLVHNIWYPRHPANRRGSPSPTPKSTVADCGGNTSVRRSKFSSESGGQRRLTLVVAHVYVRQALRWSLPSQLRSYTAIAPASRSTQARTRK